MDVQTLNRPASPSDAMRQNLARLIGVVGTGAFEQSLFQAALSATHCSHLTAFVSAPKQAPRPLLAINAGSVQTARPLALRYVKQYWDLDPANDFLKSGGVGEDGAALRLRAADIGSLEYRSDCYTGVELEDRFSLIRPLDGKMFRINFYCRSRGQGFDDEVIQNITDSADVLLALLARHDAANPPPMTAGDAGFSEQLQLLYPGMPAREIQVCTGIARGLTSEGIALEYGIAINTVLTYRKRAYARLGISSQNELLRGVLTKPVH